MSHQIVVRLVSLLLAARTPAAPPPQVRLSRPTPSHVVPDSETSERIVRAERDGERSRRSAVRAMWRTGGRQVRLLGEPSTVSFHRRFRMLDGRTGRGSVLSSRTITRELAGLVGRMPVSWQETFLRAPHQRDCR